MSCCPKCGGLVVEDQDPDSLTGLKCMNCGGNGMKPRTDSGNGAAQCAWKSPKCEEERTENSKYCRAHRDKTRSANRAYLEKRRQSGSPYVRPGHRPRSRGRAVEADLTRAITEQVTAPAAPPPRSTDPSPPAASGDLANAIRCLDDTISAGAARIEQLKAARDILKQMNTRNQETAP